MLQFLIHRPIAVILSFLAGAILGTLFLFRTPISLLPAIPIPEISVQINSPNIPASDLEKIAVQKIRQSLLQVNHLRDIESRTSFGTAYIDLKLEYGSDINLATIEVNEKIDQIVGQLPNDLERPIVTKANPSDIPIFYLNVFQNEEGDRFDMALSEWAQDILVRRLEQLSAVAFVDISGYHKSRISIIPYEASLKRHNLGLPDLEAALKQQNIKPNQFAFKDGQYQYQVEIRSNLKSVEEIENIRIRVGNQLIKIKEVADVFLSPEEREGKHLFNGHEALSLSIHKKNDAQLFALEKSVEELLNTLRDEEPNLSFVLTNNQSQLLRISIENLQFSLVFGALFAMLVMFMFYKDWKLAALIIITVPVSFLLVFLGFYLSGISINILSLAGLILGVGLMLDNAIIVIDSIHQNLAIHQASDSAIIFGANEVIRPLISSTLTTCSVFVPLIYLNGIAGALFFDQALSISIALASSLLVSYFLLPILCRLIIKEKTYAEGGDLYLIFQKSIDFLLRHRLLSVLLLFILLLSVYFPISQLSIAALPPIKNTSFELKLDWNEPIQLEEHNFRIQKLIQSLDSIHHISDAFLGKQQFLWNLKHLTTSQASIRFFYDDSELTNQLQQKITTHFYEYPYCDFSFHATENIFDRLFRPNRPDLVAHLTTSRAGETLGVGDINYLRTYLDKNKIEGIYPSTIEEINITILHDRAMHYDLDPTKIIYHLKALLNDNIISNLYSSNEVIPIQLISKNQSFFKKLESAMLQNKNGQWLNLVNFIKIDRSQKRKEIVADKTGEILPLYFKKFDLNTINSIQELTEQGNQYLASFKGQYFENQVLRSEFIWISVVSVVLLYLILAAQFESLLQPLIVLISVPIGIVGALFSLWVFGQSVNIMAIIGIIVMVGIDVNDSILKIDMINRSYRKRPNIIAAIHEGGKRRVKPIIMTSVTTIFAMIPVLFSQGLGGELQKPLAIALIGGLTVGTLSSLYVIPLIYTLFHKRKQLPF